jgi:uracil-DNA glycosylase family 4
MQEELDTIITLGFARYFLIVWELVNWCKNNDVMVGSGRGSVGGSLVAYLLGITMVDPIRHDLIFARFISPARIDLPDIDIDFEDRKRYMVREHLEKMYGKEKVAGVSTYATLKGKGSIRDVSRVFDVPISEVDKASKSIVTRGEGDMRSDLSIADAFETFEDGIAFKKKYPKITNIAITLEGQVKGTGQHAAAVIVSDEDLTCSNKAYLRAGKDDDKPIVNWGKDDAEHVGLMKLDILGLNALTVLSETRSMVLRNHGVDVGFEEIPLDDVAVYAEFNKGNTVGCFQFGSPGLRRYLTQLGITGFDDLAAANALWRPGTLRTGMVSEFVARKHGNATWERLHPIIDKITKDTYGILLYQEQVMYFMYDLAGLGWKTADNIRKVISKKKGVDQFNQYKDMFVDGCLAKGTLVKAEAEKIWENASAFGHYGFNKSHSVSYAMLAVWDMWFKVHYPAEFVACSLTFSQEDKKEDLVEEAKRLGLSIKLPKVGVSKGKEWVVQGNDIYVPFVEIAGVGDKTADKMGRMVVESDGSFGFFKGDRGIGSKIEQILQEIGADEIGTELTDKEREPVKHHFKNFSIMNDPYHAMHGMVDRMGGQIELCSIEDIDFAYPSNDNKWYLGRIQDLKFGYREKIMREKGMAESAGFADSLGGVYCMFKDNYGAFCMLVFNQKLYREKKYEVEHSDGRMVLVRCSHPHKQSNMLCNGMHFVDDLLCGNVDGVGLELIKRKDTNSKDLFVAAGCEECDLRKECKAPVLPSRGYYNVMFVGEAPGGDEDLQGRGFCGKSGNLIWDTVKKHSITREDVYLDNVVKCYPSVTKTPAKKHVRSCSKWLDAEIAAIEPVLILAFGNTPLLYFKDQEKGIMELNGTTEWSDKHKAWICWCIHPASVLYHRENMEAFEKGIDNFFVKFNALKENKAEKKSRGIIGAGRQR